MATEPITYPLPEVVDRGAWQDELDRLLVREKAHTREGDAIAAARRSLPMVGVDAHAPLVGAQGEVSLIDVFEGRRQLLVYLHMWHDGKPAAEQCEGCTFYNGQVRELAYVHSRDVTYAAFCQGPYAESVRYRDFMGWEMPWYSVEDSAERLLGPERHVNRFYLICYLRDGDRVFETYWTRGRGIEGMAPTYGLLDRTVYGRQERFEDSPPGWPKHWGGDLENPYRAHGRPTAQWPRLRAGHSDALG
jgi:predicted dithiol-disulfide oxidoreductase (DUF899 family)